MDRPTSLANDNAAQHFRYGYFEELRASLTNATTTITTTTEQRRGSTVVQVVVDEEATANESSTATTTTATTTTATTTTTTTTHRLMHVVAALPLSNGGVLDRFGLDQVKSVLLAQHHFNNRRTSVLVDTPSSSSSSSWLEDCDLRMTVDWADTQFNAQVTATVLTQHIYTLPPLYQPTAVVGAVRSAVSIPTAVLNGVHGIPQVSHTSTSTVLNQRNPFPTFGRVIPPASGDARAAIAYLTKIVGTTHLAIVYINDEYGTSYRLELQRAALQAGLTTQAVAITADQTLTPSAMVSLEKAAAFLRTTGYRHFVGIFQRHTLEYLLERGVEWQIMGPNKLWFFGDAVGAANFQQYQFPAGSPQALALHGNGILTIGSSRADGSYQRFLEAFREQEANEQFFDHLATITPLGTSESNNNNVVRYNASLTTDIPTDYSELAYDAAMSLGIAGCRTNRSFFTGHELFAAFTKSNFTGASGRVLIDPATGGRVHNTVTYVIHNIRVEQHSEPGMVRGKLVLASEFVNQGVDSKGRVVAKWQSPPGVRYNYSDFTTRPPPSLPPKQIQDILHPQVVWICNTLASLVIISAVGFAVWTWYNKNSYVVRASQPSFLLVICVGEFLMALAVVMLGATSPPYTESWASVSCMPAIWSFGFGFSLVFSALFAKTWRINKILGDANHFHRAKVTLRDASLPGCFMVLGGLLVMAAWQATDPLQYKLKFDEYGGSIDKFGRPLEIISICSYENGFGIYFAVALMLIMATTVIAANVQAYKARHYATEFSESVYIGWSMCISLQGIILSIPVFFLDSDPNSSYLSQSAVLLLLSASTLYLIFIPKVFHQIQYAKQQEAKAKRLATRKKIQQSTLALKKRQSAMALSGYNTSQLIQEAPESNWLSAGEVHNVGTVDETDHGEFHGPLIRPKRSKESLRTFSSFEMSGRVFASRNKLPVIHDNENNECLSSNSSSSDSEHQSLDNDDGGNETRQFPQLVSTALLDTPDPLDNGEQGQTTELWNQEVDDAPDGGNESHQYQQEEDQIQEEREPFSMAAQGGKEASGDPHLNDNV